MTKKIEENELKALVSLLDDEDGDVVNHVEEKIISIGNQIIPFLEEEWEKNFNPTVQRRIEDLIHTLQFEKLKGKLAKWKESGGMDLLEGAWIVSTYPDLELEFIRQEIEQLYYEAWRNFQPDLHPFDQIKALNNVLFSKFKFGPNSKNFHSPGNSMINVVLETKKGNPISLCIIYMLIAQKLGLPVYGVNLPNLFILTYKTSELQFYVNVFNKGLIFSKKDIDNYIAQLHLNPIDLFYEPCTNVDIIKRVLRNLILSFEKASEYHKSDEIKQMLEVIMDGEDFNQADY